MHKLNLTIDFDIDILNDTLSLFTCIGDLCDTSKIGNKLSKSRQNEPQCSDKNTVYKRAGLLLE